MKMGALLHFVFWPKDTSEIRALFEHYLSEHSDKMVVIVDNIDRCSYRSRYLLLQLMNGVGRIRNLHYVISASAEEMLGVEEPRLVSVVD
jgi:hypothetical protein